VELYLTLSWGWYALCIEKDVVNYSRGAFSLSAQGTMNFFFWKDLYFIQVSHQVSNRKMRFCNGVLSRMWFPFQTKEDYDQESGRRNTHLFKMRIQTTNGR
jgi:hypothetical protein